MLRNTVLGLAGLCLVLNFGASARGNEKAYLPSVGGRYFDHRVEIPVGPFAQDDPRWTDVRLGGSTDTLGVEGCAVTSAAMVAAFYGVNTDPRRLNDFLTRTGGLDNGGYIDWSQVASVAPNRMRLVYDGVASYELIDENLLVENPVIIMIPLRDGAYHFVVIVGKEGQNYLIRDPASSGHTYPLRQRTSRIGGLCIFRPIRSPGPG